MVDLKVLTDYWNTCYCLKYEQFCCPTVCFFLHNYYLLSKFGIWYTVTLKGLNILSIAVQVHWRIKQYSTLTQFKDIPESEDVCLPCEKPFWLSFSKTWFSVSIHWIHYDGDNIYYNRRQSEICCVRVLKALNSESVGRPGVNTVGFFILTKTRQL